MFFIKFGKLLTIVFSFILPQFHTLSFETPIIRVWDHFILFHKSLRHYSFSFSLFTL